jgi:imidazolonepropionase-like amidohydrolase
VLYFKRPRKTSMTRHCAAAFCLLLLALATLPNFAQNSGSLALVGGTVYSSPTATPLRDAVVLISDGKITAVGERTKVKVPKDSHVIDCTGKTVVAGFWNSHVHFIEPAWGNAATAPAASLEKHMQEMLTQWGFTTVWDLGSDPHNTLALRQRVESGEVLGPKMLLAGDIFPKNGHPAYLPPEMQLPEAGTPEEAAGMARDDLKMGMDGMKLFTGAFMGDKPVVNMDAAIVKAAVDVAHAQGQPVFAHPQNKIGLDNAVDGGVDVLAHTIPSTEFRYTSEELARFKSQHTALIPTLTLWTTIIPDQAATARIVQAGVEQLKVFSANGGPVLFGTDVGFIKIYDTSLEVEFMHRALPVSEVLASLTTNPATYFKVSNKGRVEKGLDADIVVLEGDPADDVQNLAKVDYTIRAGRAIYQKLGLPQRESN